MLDWQQVLTRVRQHYIQFSFYFLCTKSIFFQERKSLYLASSFIQKTGSYQWRWNVSNFLFAFALVSLQINPKAKLTKELGSICPMLKCFPMASCMLPYQELDQPKQFQFSNLKVNVTFHISILKMLAIPNVAKANFVKR